MIDFNKNKIKHIAYSFEKDFFKVMNNTGKTKFRLANHAKDYTKYANNLQKIFYKDLEIKTVLTLDKQPMQDLLFQI